MKFLTILLCLAALAVSVTVGQYVPAAKPILIVKPPPQPQPQPQPQPSSVKTSVPSSVASSVPSSVPSSASSSVPLTIAAGGISNNQPKGYVEHDLFATMVVALGGSQETANWLREKLNTMTDKVGETFLNSDPIANSFH